MRIATLGLLAALSSVSVSAALAADLDYGVLRGAEDDYAAPAPLIDWSGLYVGGHGGYASSALGFPSRYATLSSSYFTGIGRTDDYAVAVNSATGTMYAIGRRASGESYGGFIGYNFQMDEVVFGFEADYTSFNRSGRSLSLASRSFYNNTSQVDLLIAGTSTTEITDYGTVRGRLGYAFGDFLPYVTGGIAIGRAKISEQVGVTASDPTFNLNLSQTSFGRWTTAGIAPAYAKTKTVGGVALGAGLEYAITPSILLRGEYQYVLFDDFDGHKANINTVRGGAALKF